MNLLERSQQRLEHLLDLEFCHLTAPFNARPQRFPLEQFHHQIRGAVLLEHRKNAHYRRMAQPQQGLGLGAELLTQTVKLELRRCRHHDRVVWPSAGVVSWEQFLERHPHPQTAVQSYISDAETSLAQHFLEGVLTISKLCSGG